MFSFIFPWGFIYIYIYMSVCVYNQTVSSHLQLLQIYIHVYLHILYIFKILPLLPLFSKQQQIELGVQFLWWYFEKKIKLPSIIVWAWSFSFRTLWEFCHWLQGKEDWVVFCTDFKTKAWNWQEQNTAMNRDSTLPDGSFSELCNQIWFIQHIWRKWKRGG